MVSQQCCCDQCRVVQGSGKGMQWMHLTPLQMSCSLVQAPKEAKAFTVAGPRIPLGNIQRNHDTENIDAHELGTLIVH